MLEILKENLASIILAVLAVIGLVIACVLYKKSNKKEDNENVESQDYKDKNAELENKEIVENEDENLKQADDEQEEISQKEDNIEEDLNKDDIEDVEQDLNDEVLQESTETDKNIETKEVDDSENEENIIEGNNTLEENTENNIETEQEGNVENVNKENVSNDENILNKEETSEENIVEEKVVEDVEIQDNEQNIEDEKDIEDSEHNEENERNETEHEERAKYVGKWVITHKADKEYIVVLKASNGQLVLTSESYVTIKSAEQGIATIKKNVHLGNFQIYNDKKDNYYYKLKDSSNRLLCIGEIYDTRKRCESAIESVKKFAEKSQIQKDIVEDLTMINYVPSENVELIEEDLHKKEQYAGKWHINKDGEMYYATLCASNGQVLLNSEKYKSSDLTNIIEKYKKYSANNNFVIDMDKNGKFYYKLRTDQKLTLAVSETYPTQKSCISAIESFKKFCLKAKIIPYEEQKIDKETDK